MENTLTDEDNLLALFDKIDGGWHFVVDYTRDGARNYYRFGFITNLCKENEVECVQKNSCGELPPKWGVVVSDDDMAILILRRPDLFGGTQNK